MRLWKKLPALRPQPCRVEVALFPQETTPLEWALVATMDGSCTKHEGARVARVAGAGVAWYSFAGGSYTPILFQAIPKPELNTAQRAELFASGHAVRQVEQVITACAARGRPRPNGIYFCHSPWFLDWAALAALQSSPGHGG